MATFREMRRANLAMPYEEALEVLRQMDTGVLATVNEEGDPRATAVNYVMLDDETLVFHGSKEGEKMDNMRSHPNVSFFVIARDEILEKQYTTNYKSVSVHGHAEIIEGDEAFSYLAKMTHGLDKKPSEQEIHDYAYNPARIKGVVIVLLHIDHLTGKYGSHSPEVTSKDK